jgi:hypothetical protein
MRGKGKRWSMADVIAASHGSIPAAGAGASPNIPAKPGKPKYRNKKVVDAQGEKFDSGGERDRYAELLALEAAGAITALKRSVPFVLAPACDLGETQVRKGKVIRRTKPALRYIADFTYREDGVLVVEDFKSDITRKQPVYRIKKHLMRTVHGILIRETRKK